MSFKDIKGQDKAISILRNAITDGKVSHAYIFWGPESVGKRLTAMNFAKALNCLGDETSRSGPVEGCDRCVSCKKIDSLNHPDVFLFAPEKDSSSIGIAKIRALIKDIGLKPYEARKKVYIIDGADEMTREASNAFLKTLEEPPSGSVLILIAKDLRDLLPTIASRAQGLKFYPLGIDEVKDILIKEYKADETLAQALAHLSGGRLGAALKYKDEDFLRKRSRIIDGLCNDTLFDSDFDGISRSDLRLYLDIMLTWYRDVMIAMCEGTGGESALVNIDRKDVILKEAKRAGFSYIDNMIKQIILTGSFLDINANPKLAMSVLGIAISENAR